MVARLWLLTLEFANITDEALDSSSTKSSVTVVTLSPSLAVLVRNDEDAGPHIMRVLLWLQLMPTVLDADDEDANASTQFT